MHSLSRGLKTAVLGMSVCFAGVGVAGAQQEFRSNTAIIINDGVPATPYPSNILVTGMKRPVARVTVEIRGFSHTFPADVGILLVSPSGTPVVLSGRCGGATGVVGLTIDFDDKASSGLPTPLVSGTFRPTGCFAAAFAAPAPAGGFGAPLSTFDGENPNGTWRLFVQDFAGADVGTIAGGYSIFITEVGAGADTFRNTGAITIRDNNTALPYPSNIVVAGLDGFIGSVAVRLHGFSHTFPADVGMLLVGPNGQAATLMLDRGGATDAVNLELGFADTAPPPPAVWVSGTFHPSNDNPGFNFAAPAPAGPYATAFSTFAGGNPNGTWSLYVQDHVGIDAGSISGGWDLTIYAGPECPADFNNDGVVNSQDFFDYLAAFFAGCP